MESSLVRTVAFAKFGCCHSSFSSFQLLIIAPFEYTQHRKVMKKSPSEFIGPNCGINMTQVISLLVDYLLAESLGCSLQPLEMRSISVRFAWKEHALLLLKVRSKLLPYPFRDVYECPLEVVGFVFQVVSISCV